MHHFFYKITKFLIFLLIIFAIIIFSHTSLMINIDTTYALENTIQDTTFFDLHYEGKHFNFSASEFKIFSKVFMINEKISKYKRNGSKSDKIQILNRAINLGLDLDIAFNYIFPGLDEKINKIEKWVNTKSTDASVKINKYSNNPITINKEIVGITLDKNKLFKMMYIAYTKTNYVDLEIPIIKTIPKITKEKLLLQTNKLSEFKTNISTSSNARKHNIKLALNSINGKILQPNETFSFNDIVGNRTENRGYKMAKVITNGEFVEGIGGGVCQVSTTVYNAMLLAGLTPIISFHHSQRVSYVPIGLDAMVNYGTADLKFKNTSQYPVYIFTTFSNNEIGVKFYGYRIDNISYKLISNIEKTISSDNEKIEYDKEKKYTDKIIYDDEFFYLKKHIDGYVVNSYRLTIKDGVVINKELLRHDTYKPQTAIKIYGVEKRPKISGNVDNSVDNLKKLCIY